MEFWLWMPQLFACTRTRIKTQINRGLSPIIRAKDSRWARLRWRRVRPARCAHPSRQLDRVATRHNRQRRLQRIDVSIARGLHRRHLHLQFGEFLVDELDAL